MRLSFNAWLQRQHTRTDAIGDLARDMRNDPHWPKRKRSLARYSDHIRVSSYSEGALQALYYAWYEWGKEHARQERQRPVLSRRVV